ncbi:MAG: hypothetical protein VX608_05575 [Chloroflexota bacterium]|nr:hypothetical protein [Chloroflexota bacterium]
MSQADSILSQRNANPPVLVAVDAGSARFLGREEPVTQFTVLDHLTKPGNQQGGLVQHFILPIGWPSQGLPRP